MWYSKLLLFLGLAISCILNVSCFVKEKQSQEIKQADILPDIIAPQIVTTINIPDKSLTEAFLDSMGLINISNLDSTLCVRLIYAQPDNFTGKILYDDLNEAYLHPDAATALVHAHLILKQQHPFYRFIIYDAARPMSVQKRMWNIVRKTPQYMYVSNPSRGGGLHNYGLAVDISILDSLGNSLPMGTEVDYFGPEAHINREMELVRSGKISEQERLNRILLRQVMKKAGFRALPNEWWHFNLCSRETAKKNYHLIP